MKGYKSKHYDFPTVHYCRTLELRDNPELIREYRRRHEKGNVWQEIIDGIRQVGILEMEIYILGTRLFMIVETPADLDLDAAMDKLATLPRQAEWEAYMSELQDTSADATSDEKWQMMERMFYLYQ
ncbi:MAG: L-rhamnose mutarotase [Bacteroidales bacterium]|nr:L-rhamnose mutarotase [Bacteroidales bacterium]